MNLKKKNTSTAIFSRLLAIQLFLPSLIIAVFLFVVSGFFTLSSIEREQFRVAHSIGKIMDDFLADSKLTLKIAADTADYSDQESLFRLLTNSQEANTKIDSLFALNNAGTVIAISPQNTGDLHSDRSNEPYFIQGRASEQDFWISQPYQNNDSSSMSIFITRRSRNGSLIVGQVNLKNLLDMVNTFVDPQVGRTIFIHDEFLNILTQSDPLEIEPQTSSDQQLFILADGSSIFFRQNHMIIQSKLKLTETNWDVVVQLNPNDVLRSYLVTIALIGIGMLTLWWIILLNIRRDFTRLIANPLTELRKYILNITASNFSDKTRPVKMNAPLAEISDLASSFDQMSLAVYLRQYELKESEKKYRALIDQSGDAIFLESNHRLVIINPKFTEIFGLSAKLLDQKPSTISDYAAEASREIVIQKINSLNDGEITGCRFEFVAIGFLRKELDVEVSASAFAYQGGYAVQGILRDITDHKRIEREEREQRLLAEALRDTAAALNSTLNLDEVMERILENIKRVVPHESSSIMLVQDPPVYANITAVNGYQQHGMEIWAQNAQLHISQTPTLAFMYETGRPIAVPDVIADPTWIKIRDDDWIRSYVGAPIKVKDEVIGFLNLESSLPGFFNHQHTERLQAFADQAGIAIQNARLLSELTRTNQDLILAYETTLQGWSKALEIRDYETHGHTMRVLEQTVKLARRMGISQAEILNLKYGVLLHDIGKLFIPDDILKEKRSLSEEEWLIMRQHPVYAFEILSPISYLGASIDIPYCHHERWDGTGYPRGLVGNQIPLAARIFTVIDIWDAITSDRHYRDKWQYNEAIEYIQQQSGKILDPNIVKAFIQMKKEELEEEKNNGHQANLIHP